MFRKLHFALSACVALAVMLLPQSAAAQITADVDQIAEVMRDAGYRAEITEADDGTPKIESATAGYNFAVLFYGCEGVNNCKTIQLFSWKSLKDDQITLEKLNSWNSGMRFARAHRDSDGDPIIQMDIDLEDGGMPAALLKDNLEYWDSILADFMRFISDKERQTLSD